MRLRRRRIASFVDSLIEDRRPRRFRAGDEEVALLQTAVMLREARGPQAPSPPFVSGLLEELAFARAVGSDGAGTTHTPRGHAAGRSRRVGARPLAAVVAALLTVIAATTAIDRGALGGSTGHASEVVDVALTDASHRRVGEIRLLSGAPSWVLMNLAGVAYDGPVTCQLEGADGTVLLRRSFYLNGGDAAFARVIPISPGEIRSGRIVTPSGTVLASAVFEGRGR
ncbi:MAG: hypothetical protein FWC87_13185 [Acidimicrobiaceae bacterium]|nr:hypothetical protein [Acidimicrobiaceae bacterium]